MAEKTNIEWADGTFNPWTGCHPISPACDNCYAEAWAKRAGRDFGDLRRTTAANWREPLRWNKQHEEFLAVHGRRRRVFCASLADVFDNQAPDEWRRDLWDLIELTPNLNWLILTKRIGNVIRMARTVDWFAGRDNAWLGATIANQEEADRDIPKLLATPARVRFVSMEPLLGPVDLTRLPADTCASECCGMQRLDSLTGNEICDLSEEAFDNGARIDWVIAGGESGPRPSHPDWFRGLRDQCTAARVPFLFKQWGSHLVGEMDADKIVIKWQDGRQQWWGDGEDIKYQNLWQGSAERPYIAWPKRKAGRLLDGRTWDQFPEVR